MRKRRRNNNGGSHKTNVLLRSSTFTKKPAAQPVAAGSTSVIYMSELDYLLRLIGESPDIETGGQLFGFHKDDGTPVVLYAIGAGPCAKHHTAFFVQDADYLLRVGGVLTDKFGLEHIGEWHSHHRLGLTHPSGHDAHTIRVNMERYGMNRCLLCIGTIDGTRPRIDAYGFTRGIREYTRCQWIVKTCDSPFRTVIGDEYDILNSNTI